MTTSLAVVGSLAEYRAAELVESLSADQWRAGFDGWRIDDSAGLKTLSADFLSETFADLARYLIFAVQGINTKSYSLWQVFQDALENDKVLRWADLGSGSGFLGIEIASQKPLHVFNIDKSLAQSRLGIDMMRCFPTLVGECNFITSRLEDAELPDDLDAVSMLTTLCYVPREAQRPLLRRSWDALRSGGALVIFENIKSKAYTRDYDLMLEEAELDGMLNELGGKSMHYHALTGGEMKAEAAAGKTCYRVRIKP
jgi:SAM-dependent methyltransferase